MNDIRFIHIRKKDKEGRLLARGGITYGYALTDDGRLLVSWAKCSKKDNFCKALGRKISAGRLHARSNVVVVPAPEVYGSLHQAVMANV